MDQKSKSGDIKKNGVADQENSERRRAIFDQSFQFIGLTQANGTLIEVDRITLNFCGITREEVINRPFWEARLWQNSPQTRAKLQQAIACAAAGETVIYEENVLGAGDTFATINLSIKPILAESKQVILLMVEGQDITERKQALSEIHELKAELKQQVVEPKAQLEVLNHQLAELIQREREALKQLEVYADIFKSMQFGLIVWRLEDANDITSFRLVTSNPAANRQTGVTLENQIGTRITECFPNMFPKHREFLESYVKVATSGVGIDQCEMYYGDESVPDSFFSVKVFPLPDRCIGIAFDNITQNKQAELALHKRAEELTLVNTVLAQTTALLRKRNDELDQFAYVTSHDLKAPLRAIANLSEWIEEDLKDQLPEENQHQMHLLRGRVHRMEALINGLLEFSRVGRVQMPSAMVNVTTLLNEVIDSLGPPATFTIEVEPQMPTFMTKQLALQQVFSNLIHNAIQHHTRLDGYVKISVHDRLKHYEFAVTDDGPGIAREYHDKVFAIFQTLEARDHKESTGIGLAIVKKIVETEAGTITLESEVGLGSTFRFTWPKQPQD